MRVKLDENLPRSLVEVLEGHGHDVDTVVDEGLAGSDDATVFARAGAEGRLFMTLDGDFADIRAYPPGQHPGVVVVRLDTPRPSLIRAAVSGLLARHALEDLAGCVAIVQLGGVRVRRKPTEER